MEKDELPGKSKWYSIKEAGEYLNVGEPTIYRWMREGKITYRKVGDSTRFWQEDLDSVMQVYHSAKDLEKVRDVCPLCRHDDLVDGHVQSTGLNYFRPRQAKFWTLKPANITATAKMCARCGAITWFGDTKKLSVLRTGTETKETTNAPAAEKDRK